MGLRPGGGQRAGRVVLVEQGPWGEAWAWWAAGGILDTVARLRAWAGEDPRALWTRLKDAPVPADRGERVATWAVLAFWTHGRGPARIEGNRWRTGGGFNATEAYAAEYGLSRAEERRDARLPDVADALELLPRLDALDVRRADARTVEPIPGAHVYIDPDYVGTTGYGHTFPRPDVVEVAERWKAAGCTVAISEAEPIALPGWYHHELGKPVGNRRTWSRQKREWLTMSHRPVGVLDFGVASTT